MYIERHQIAFCNHFHQLEKKIGKHFKVMHTVSMKSCCIVVLRLLSHRHPSSSSSSLVNCTRCSFGVLKSPWQKSFIFGHSLTITFSKTGNSKWWSPKEKLARLGRQLNCKYSSWLKTMPPLTSSPSHAMISSIISQSVMLILLSSIRLLAVEQVIKAIDPWHLETFRVVKFLKDTDDGTKVFNLEHSSRKWLIGRSVDFSRKDVRLRTFSFLKHSIESCSSHIPFIASFCPNVNCSKIGKVACILTNVLNNKL